MFRRFHHVAFAALLAIQSGCVNVHTDPDKPAKSDNARETPPEAGDAREIKEARQTKEKLQREARELGQMGYELDSITTRIADHHPVIPSAIPTGSVDTVIKSLIQTITPLREAQKAILEKGPRYVDKIDSFYKTLGDAPNVITTAANLFRSYADDEPYADIAEDYRQVATLFDNFAARTQETGATVKKRYNRAALLETLKYIRHQERFLDRFESALLAQNLELSAIESLVREIDAYVRKYEQLRTQIRELNAALGSLQSQTQAQPPQNANPSVPGVEPPLKPVEAAPKPVEAAPAPVEPPAKRVAQPLPENSPAHLASRPL